MFHVAFCSDSNYIELLKVAVFSLVKNNNKIKIHILKIDSFDSFEIDKICDSFGVSVRYYDLDIDLPNKGRFSKAMFGRFYIPELIDEDEILYLDCDIVVNGKLDGIFNEDVNSSKLLIATSEDDSPIIKAMKNRLDVDDYFNSGVLLIKNNKETKDKFYQCVDFIKANNDWLTYPDQDAINAIFKHDIGEMNMRYNYFRSFECKESPIIFHYAHEKPWVPFSVNYYSNVYFDILELGRVFNLRKFEYHPGLMKYISLFLKKILKKIGLMRALQRLVWK